MNKYYNYYLLFIVIFTLSIKWVLSISEFGFSPNSLLLFNLEDTQYFPIVYSLSDFNIAPTYLESLNSNKIIGFPILGIITHALLFKFIGIYSFIILEYFFQLIFLVVIYKLFIKVFSDYKKSFYFIIYLMILSSLTANFYQFEQTMFFENLYSLFSNNLGTRFPRPLITGILIFLFIFYILDFQKQLEKNFDKIYIIKISIILSLILNTFFYYFIIFSILLIGIILRNYSKKILTKIIFKRFFLFLFTFLFFILPFILQQIYLEPDYANRIGLINLDNFQKYHLITYFLQKIFSFKFLPIFLVSLLLFYFLNKDKKKDYKKMNTFFYLILSSILSPIIFVVLSPSIISIYHLVDIILFNLVFYLLIGFFSIIYEFIKETKFSKYLINDQVIFVPMLILVILNCVYESKKFNQKKRFIKESIKIEKFLENKEIHNTKLKLFTNDRIAANIWLLKKNYNLLISDGFTNSLNNSQIEYNLINSLKFIGFSEENFKNFISIGKGEIRNSFFIRLFIYRYQANSLYTHSEINNYSKDLINKIKNTSPFRAQNQIVPENEKKRLISLFVNHKIEDQLVPDYLIINQSNISKYFEISNKKYTEIFSSENYKIYSR